MTDIDIKYIMGENEVYIHKIHARDDTMGIFADYVREQAKEKKEEPREWLEHVLKYMDKCVLATHAGKFIHPSTDVSLYDVRVRAKDEPDGYVTTSQVVTPLDIVTPANYLASAKLLLLELENGDTVYQNAKDDTVLLKEGIEGIGLPYAFVRERLFSVKGECPHNSDDRLRQVYFPLGKEEAYHLLTVLPSSGIAISLTKRIQAMERLRREARDAKSGRYEAPHQELYGLVPISYGGAKAQNISARNNETGGKAYLLPSMPPILEERSIRRPKRNFFRETLWRARFQVVFQELHKFLRLDRNNMEIRSRRETIIDRILDQVFTYVYALREVEAGWSDGTELPISQKLWLDAKYQEDRYRKDTWQKEISQMLARWIVHNCENLLKDEKVLLGDAEFREIEKRVLQVLRLDEEGLL